MNHRCRKTWKEAAKRTRGQGPILSIPQFTQGPANSWLLMEENHLVLLLAHDPWSLPAFTKTSAQDQGCDRQG